MIKRTVLTTKTTPNYKGKMTVLQDVLVPDEEVPEEFYVNDKDLPRWKFLKGRKNLVRVSKRTGRKYRYDEGSMVFPDDLDKPSRTIVTGEGGGTPSRFKHVVKAQNGRLRRLTPVELERLNMFPDNHTSGESDTKRAFLMGNALVVGVVTKLGKGLVKAIDN
jgi:DNA (cytosine-5)-methyltransferase 1